jgi:hypothetical protein
MSKMRRPLAHRFQNDERRQMRKARRRNIVRPLRQPLEFFFLPSGNPRERVNDPKGILQKASRREK